MTKRIHGAKKIGTNGASAVCETHEIYYRMIRYFREALAERVSQHEDEVFSARARFQMQHEQDQEHLHRTREKWLRRKGGHRGNDAGVMPESETPEDDADGQSMLEEFLADQRKLKLEHEEELQQDYPLAFLGESAGAVAFTLIPLFQSKLMALAQERTWQNKEIQKVLGEEKDKMSASSGSYRPERDICIRDVLRKSKNALVKEEQGQCGVAAQDVGRGAYLIIPQPHDSPMSGAVNCSRSSAERQMVNETEKGGKKEKDKGHIEEGDGSELQSRERNGSGVVSLPWPADTSTHGALEFVRIALLCNGKSRLARHDEKRRFLERCMIPSMSLTALQTVQGALQRVSLDERRDIERENEIWRVWQTLKDTLVSEEMGVVTGKEEGNGATEEAEHKHTENGVNMSSNPLEEWHSPSYLVLQQRRMRLERPGGSFKNKFDIPPGSTCGSSTLDMFQHDGISSFGINESMTINLDDDTNSGDNSRMEALAQTYLWPHHIENSIPHVLCGEARRAGKRWLVPLHETPKGKTQTGESSSQELTHGIQTEETDPSYPPSLLVVAFPQSAQKVWLKVGSQGDFVANEVKFYQSRTK